MLAFIDNAYTEEIVGDPTSLVSSDGARDTRVVLKIDKRLAPVKIAILPLSKKDELTNVSKEIFKKLSKKYFVEHDITQSIGKRYRRQDEIGTPYCVTIDFDSLEDKSVTVRDRDTMKQERIAIDKLAEYFDLQFA